MRIRAILLTVLLAAPLAGPAPAQGIDFSPAPTETCLAGKSGPARAACIGKAAAACLVGVRSATEIDQAVCLNLETEWWLARMDTAYAEADRKAALLDIQFAHTIARGAPRMTGDLAAMHAAWKDWSEKRCFFAALTRRGKEDRTVVASDCMLTQTATEVLLLEDAAALPTR